MAIYSIFVGINKYADEEISELASATFDAMALWALFKDSVPTINSMLLLDNQATKHRIINEIAAYSNKLTSEDTLLFFFAGHGSENHHLITYDTVFENLDDTSISMQELLVYIDGKQSRTVVFLDCCFSGGVANRVLSSPALKLNNSSLLDDLAGTGRIIIAASQSDQVASEINGHGVFTKALLDVFIESKDEVSIGHLIDEVPKRMRAQTGFFGGQQNPVIFNHIVDSFQFPRLFRGSEYKKFFPDTSVFNVSHNIEDLLCFGLSKEILLAWSEQFPDGLNSLQVSAINDHRILDGESLLTVAPTSSGKTFIGEMAIAKAITKGLKAIFLLPYKALTNEKYQDFNELYGDRLGYRVISCTGDYSDDVANYLSGRYDIALFTYEMFLTILLSAQYTLNYIGLVVVDEVHFINDSNRGINLELLLTNLILQRRNGVCPQLLALSAVIGDVNCFTEWLNCDLQISEDRPVPLIEGVLDYRGVFQFVDIDGTTKTEQFLPMHSIIQRGKKASSQDIIVPLVKKLISDGEIIIVFRNAKGPTVGSAKYLAKSLGLPPAKEIIDSLSLADASNSTLKLIESLDGGVCFHNSDLNRHERKVLEQNFRKNNGDIKVMAATTTVAAGVNTPASTVIIVESFFYSDTGNQSFKVGEYKNMAGRAGRLGISDKGKSILLANNAHDREKFFNKYVKGIPEDILSSFSNDDIDTWVMRLLIQVSKIPRNNVINLLCNTFGGYLANRANMSWSKNIAERLNNILDKMLSLELIEEIDSEIELTLLGKACAKSSLSFSSAMQLVKLLNTLSEGVTAFELIAVIQCLPEISVYTPIMKKGNKENQWVLEVSNFYGHKVAKILQSKCKDNWEYYARCKRASIISAWIKGVPLADIETKYTASPYQGFITAGNVRGFADVTKLYFRAAIDIANVLLLEKSPDSMEVDVLFKSLEIGLPTNMLFLLDLGLPLLRGEYISLYEYGCKDKESLKNLQEADLRKIIKSVDVELFIKSADII